MEKEIKDLAEKLLISRIEAYMNANAPQIIGKHVVQEWYRDCEILATEIKNITGK